MLIVHVALAAIAVGLLATRPRRLESVVIIAAAAGADVAFGASLAPARVVIPLVAFLAGALTLAALVECSGLAERVATVIAWRAHGSGLVLYALSCALCALLTAVVSLDGAV